MEFSDGSLLMKEVLDSGTELITWFKVDSNQFTIVSKI